MSTEHVVVPTAECYTDPTQAVRCKYGLRFGDCAGCLGDGRRALLDQAMPVERGDIGGTWWYNESEEGFIPGVGRYYREVES